MISYEKVGQSFKTATIITIIINALLTLIYSLSFAGIFILQKNLQNTDFTDLYTAKQLEVLKSGTTAYAIFITALALLVALAILIFSSLNLSKFKKKNVLSYVPHILGIGISLLNIILSFADGFNRATLIIQALLAALYAYTFTRARLLNNQDSMN